MTVTVIPLPGYPLYNAGTPYLLSQAADLTSPLGGVAQRIVRVGSRFGIDVAYPAMKYANGMTFLSRLMQSEGNPVAVAFPQRGLTVGSPGTVVVNGGGQSGTSLAVRGVTNGYTFTEGQFFDFITGGRRYVQIITANVTAGSSGDVTLPIWPMMRASPLDGDALEITAPYLEGFIALQSKKITWTIELIRRVGLKFSVTEDR